MLLLPPLAPASAGRALALLVAVMALILGAFAPAPAAVPAPGVVSAERGDLAAGQDTSATPLARKGCAKKGKKFRPTSLGITGVITSRAVLALGRDANNVPKAPPLTDAGKRQFAWDLQDKIKAGSKHGVIKLNGHTYPDGSAVGNTLINQLYEGARIVVRGKKGQRRCYDVIDRVQITAEKRFKRYYRTDGPPRLAIAVCSGVRRGPGDWSHRTIWFAKPVR